ncbi:MAG: 2-oxoacid:acceptor oxidoreductase family protein [Endomicrobia bacterium]|nr:2-oxoacid:acceptor oxidoreductase family protein [Endomicrobiia bacterium]
MYEEIFIAGSGGQGVLSMGKILVYCALKEDKYVTYYPSYGAEIRGGTANCMVKISDSFIYSPVIEKPSVVVVFNMPSYIKFLKKIVPQKYLFINSSLVEEEEDIKNFLKDSSKNLKIIKVAVTELANKIGSSVVSNVIMIGALIKELKIIDISTIKFILPKIFNKKFIDINLKALDIGYKL